MWSRANNVSVFTEEVRASTLTSDINSAIAALPINCIIQEIIVGPHHQASYVTNIASIGPYATSALAWAALQSTVNAAAINVITFDVVDLDGDFYAFYSYNTAVLVNRYLLTIVYNISNDPQEFKVNTNGSQPLKVKICEY